jgi:hypothetical protein
MKEQEGVCWRCGQEGHVVKNCIADMLEDVKWMIVNHVHIAITSLDNQLFAFVSKEVGGNLLCESAMYGSGKQGKLKQGREEEFAW